MKSSLHLAPDNGSGRSKPSPGTASNSSPSLYRASLSLDHQFNIPFPATLPEALESTAEPTTSGPASSHSNDGGEWSSSRRTRRRCGWCEESNPTALQIGKQLLH